MQYLALVTWLCQLDNKDRSGKPFAQRFFKGRASRALCDPARVSQVRQNLATKTLLVLSSD
jgi:hypothetical protein